MDKASIKINTTPAIKEQFEALECKNNTERLALLLKTFVTKQDLDVDVEKLRQAASKLNTTTGVLMVEAIESYIASVLEGKNVKADLAAYELLKGMMCENENETEKTYINPYTFKAYIKKATGGAMNQEVMKRCFRLHSKEIDEHHIKLNLYSNHNREKPRQSHRKI